MQDTRRTYQDVFPFKINENETNSDIFQLEKALSYLNLIDENEIACAFVNYLRYVLRLTSAFTS